MDIGNPKAPRIAGTWHLWTFGVMVGSMVYRRLVEQRGSVMGLVDSKQLVGVDWSCLMGGCFGCRLSILACKIASCGQTFAACCDI